MSKKKDAKKQELAVTDEAEFFSLLMKLIKSCEEKISVGTEHLLKKFNALKKGEDIPHSKVTPALKEFIEKGVTETSLTQLIKQAKFDMMFHVFSVIDGSGGEESPWILFLLGKGESENPLNTGELSETLVGYAGAKIQDLANEIKRESLSDIENLIKNLGIAAYDLEVKIWECSKKFGSKPHKQQTTLSARALRNPKGKGTFIAFQWETRFKDGSKDVLTYITEQHFTITNAEDVNLELLGEVTSISFEFYEEEYAKRLKENNFKFTPIEYAVDNGSLQGLLQEIKDNMNT